MSPLATTETITTAITIAQMDCPTEEALIRNKLNGMAGISGLSFNLMQRVLTVTHAPAAQASIISAIETLGFSPVIETPSAAVSPAAQPSTSKHWWWLLLAGILALLAETFHFMQLLAPWLPAGCAVLAIALSGLSTYKKGWIALLNRTLNINALMSIAVTGAMILRQWPEAAMVMVLFALAEKIEAASLDRARNAIRGLMSIAPTTATIKSPSGDWQTVDAKTVKIGAIVRIKPGERVPLDGEVISGLSSLDQAPITGESIPVEKQKGDPLFAGSINQNGELEYKVTAQASDSTLARIIQAVESAQGKRAPTQRFVDQFAQVYTPTVFVLAVLVAVLPPLLLHYSWHEWVYKALVLLVIACPCALVISTPVTVVSGLAAAAKKGILIKGGIYLEQGYRLNWLALDKTGTLTEGRPKLTDAEILEEEKSHIIRLALSLAARSDH
ncbi:MAG TPA: heavy metal translocating P-type ATPase, partial [Pseudomonadales bacterium]|nr:heavy metal translocating P-type ATPase [Pseudomonadales bacterium]